MQRKSFSTRSLKKIFWIAIVLTILALLFMRFVTNGLSGKSIIEFEMAKTVEKAEQIIKSWSSESTIYFIKGIYADFIFIITYTIALFFGCRYMGYLSGHAIFRKAGYVFSFFAVGAGFCDVLENIGMLYTIKKQVTGWVVHLTYDMAFIKFSLIFISLLFMLICLFYRGIDMVATNKKKSTL